MNSILVDHNINGQAGRMWMLLSHYGWLNHWPLDFIKFDEIALPITTSDRAVWQLAQENQFILLTANRRATGQESLQETIDLLNTSTSLPVVTIGNVDRMTDNDYLLRCGLDLIDILERHPTHL